MTILLTGNKGYIGSVLGSLLIEKGYDVIGFDTGYYDGLGLYPAKPLQRQINKDVRDIEQKDLKGVDTVIHLAELSNDPLGQIDSDITYKINHLATVAMARKAKKAGVQKFVYFSSCSVYGASNSISSENSLVNPLTAYAKCKVLNEQALSKLADKNFSPVILRNATAYGPSPQMRFDLAVNNLCGVAWTMGKIAMESDGSPWRPFVHVRDICEAVVCMLEVPRKDIHNEIFNVGDTRGNYQIKEIARIISEELPKCEITLNKKGFDKRNYRVNFEKINSKLKGFSCKNTVRSGIKELFELFKKIDFRKETFLSKDFTRLKQIEYLKNKKKISHNLVWKD